MLAGERVITSYSIHYTKLYEFCGRRSTRFANPLLGYALVEAVIGAFALGFHELFVGTTDWAYATLLPALDSESLAFGAKLLLSCVLILPQSVLLGATRITSYNVCYTKLLRVGSRRPRSAGG